MSAEVAVLVPALFLLVALTVGRGRVVDVGIAVRGAADVAARAASMSAADRMLEDGRRAGNTFVRDAGVPCRNIRIDVRREESGGFVYAVARVSCSIDQRDLGGLVPRSMTMEAISREIVDYYRSER